MGGYQWHNFVFPALVVLFFAWRFWRFHRVRKELPELLRQGALVVDVRSPGEFAAGSRPGSLNIPLEQLNTRHGELDRSRPIVLCCASGTRSGMAAMVLKRHGFRVVNAGPWTNTLTS